ncbi:MAG: hypothetical protein QM680_04830 [Luteolibacter sp.]
MTRFFQCSETRGFFAACLASALSSFAWAGPSWEKPALSLGSLDLDGGLRQRFELGRLSGSPEFSFPIHLEHGLRPEEAVSEYKIPQLETYVVPEGRDGILWLEPGGNRHLFKVPEILAKAPERQKEPWLAISPEAGVYEFRSNDGWVYRYEGGSIKSLAAPTGRSLRFQTEGLRIVRIFQQADGAEINLLEAEENDFSQAEKLKIGPLTHEFRYHPENQQLVSWHSPQMGSRSVAFSYSPKGLVDFVTLPGGEKLTYTWGGRDGAWQKDSGLELPKTENGTFLIADRDFKFNYGISKTGINLMRTDALGIREGFIFNPRTQQLVRKNRDGGEITEFFGVRGASQNRLESARDARGRETVRLTYDEKGRVLTRTVPGQAEVRFEYDALDRISKVYRLKDLVTAYEYEGDSEKPVKITNALGDTIEISYMPDGRIRRYKNLDGAVYEYVYDALGQLTEERHPLGYTKTYERDAYGRLTRVKEIDGRERRYTYTEENRLASVFENGANWSYEYDPDGQLTRLLRDGRTWQQTEREKIAATGETVVKETDSNGDETVHRFDQNGNLVRQVDALGKETEYKRDALGQLQGWKDARGSTVEFERDAVGRIAGVDTGESAKLEMAYDLTGRIRRKNNGEQDIRFDYDKAGHLVKIDYGKGQTIDYTYDELGRILTALTGQGVKTTYTWDALDRKTSERSEIPEAGATYLEWTYTPSGKKKSVTVWGGDTPVASTASSSTPLKLLQKTTYTYDALGRYTVISVNDVPKVWYDYDPATLRLTQKRFFNGWLTRYENDPSGYPKSLIATDETGKVIKDVRYVWSPEGKLRQRTMDGIVQNYSYDSLGRITEVTTP